MWSFGKITEVLYGKQAEIIDNGKKYTGETSVVSVRFPGDMIKKLDEMAQATGRTRNEIIMLCLEFAIDNATIENKK